MIWEDTHDLCHKNYDVHYNWEPLRAIAEVAGKHWPQKVKEAALALSGKANDEPDGIGPELLSNIWTVFQEQGNPNSMTTKDLIDALKREDEWRWETYNHGKGLDARTLAQLLKPYEILSHTIRIGDKTPKGYKRKDFEDAVSRYLPPETPPQKSIPPDPPVFAATTQHSSEINGLGDFSICNIAATYPPHIAGVAECCGNVADKKSPETLQIRACGVVADKTPPSPQYLFPDTDFEGNSHTQNTKEEESWGEIM